MAKIALILLVVFTFSCSPSKYKRYTVKYMPYTLIFPDGHSVTIMHQVIDSAWLKGYVVPDLKLDTGTTYLQMLGYRCGLTHSCRCDTAHIIPVSFSSGSTSATDSAWTKR